MMGMPVVGITGVGVAFRLVFLSAFLGLVASCDGGPEGSGFSGDVSEDSLAIVGAYVDDFGSSHQITDAQWSIDDARFAILEFSNSDHVLIAANAPENAYFPGKFSRFDWTRADDDTLWYCQTAYDKSSLEDARAVLPADPARLDSSGCSGFPWSRLTSDASH
ncbi:MAG: hypothetical protein H6729_02705 [Deltaproteobacteria bacterium]|nr:hypothetical protein [Deltaproteobacteria bacterium]